MNKETRGITLVELILSISVIGMFSAMAIINFRSNKQDDILRIAGFRVADAVRAAQSYALAGVPEGADPAVAAAQVFGVYIYNPAGTDIGEALIFADGAGGQAGVYDSGFDTEIRNISLDSDNHKTVILDGIQRDTVSGTGPVTIAFKKPDAAGSVDGGTSVQEVLLTFKHTQSGRLKTVTINRVTGRVDAQF